jgi:phosphoribosylaminoimidazole (AIR) synthetase
MILAVSKRNLAKAWSVLDRLEERSYEIGRVVEARTRRVIYVP